MLWDSPSPLSLFHKAGQPTDGLLATTEVFRRRLRQDYYLAVITQPSMDEVIVSILMGLASPLLCTLFDESL